MRFMSLYKPGFESDVPPTEQEMMAMGALIEESMKAGVLVATDGLLSSRHGVRVRVDDDGMYAVTDGPFADAKQLVGGYAILEARSKEHAIELAKQFLAVVGRGECEVRQMYEAPAADIRAFHVERASAGR